jgi:hypothetical protein
MRPMFKIERLSKNQQLFHNKKLLSNSTIKQIVIVRHPRETIISFCVLKEYLKNKDESIINSAVSNWVEYHQEILNNMDHLYPFLFEQTIENPVKCLVRLSEILSIPRIDDYEAEKFFNDHHRQKGLVPKQVQQSSKVSDSYGKYEEYYESLSPDIHSTLNALYLQVCEAIRTRQEKLHIVV